MVVGNTSKYVEGFESFTLDDEMMLANLKQAVNYTKANMAISDVEMKLTNTTPTIKNSPPIKPQGRTINSDIPMPTKANTNNTVIRTTPTIAMTGISSISSISSVSSGIASISCSISSVSSGIASISSVSSVLLEILLGLVVVVVFLDDVPVIAIVGKTYRVKGYGIRVPFLSMHYKIYSISM